MSRHGFPLVLLAFTLVQPQPTKAQTTTGAPAHIGVIEGTATLERDAGETMIAASMPFVPGDRIRTERGRLEILFGDGSTVYLDEYSALDMLSDSRLRLLSGRLTLIAAARIASPYQVDTPAASVRIGGPGEYRITTQSRSTRAETDVATVRGSAQLITDAGAVWIQAGERSLARDSEAPMSPQAFNSARWDVFERWTEEREGARRGAASARYLPPELQAYAGTFDRYGSWAGTSQYGYVWYPSVRGAWRPYYNGRWTYVRPYGWTWIGADVWAWPTHHYGRWGMTALGAWYWIPDRTWGPAWVHWGIAPGFVSWCALGFDGRPVVPFWARPDFAVNERVFDPSFAWTTIPETAFGAPIPVLRVAIDRGRLRATDRPAFITQQVPPHAPRPARPDTVGWPSSGSVGGPVAVSRSAPPGAERSASPSAIVTMGVQRTGPLRGFERPAMIDDMRAVPRNRWPEREGGWAAAPAAQPSPAPQPVLAAPHGVIMPGAPLWLGRMGAPATVLSPAPAAPVRVPPGAAGAPQLGRAVPRMVSPPPNAAPAAPAPPPRAVNGGMVAQGHRR